ncbi:hypothetical protein UF75_3714 [Desulfosporosinus sp. I2]|nr:hypothetical protein [Desulfosporosinus sp. I2]KJR45911.1 hypothetical protein UF75_3714 [Desulfosporosinus sp. I2]
MAGSKADASINGSLTNLPVTNEVLKLREGFSTKILICGMF